MAKALTGTGKPWAVSAYFEETENADRLCWYKGRGATQRRIGLGEPWLAVNQLDTYARILGIDARLATARKTSG